MHLIESVHPPHLQHVGSSPRRDDLERKSGVGVLEAALHVAQLDVAHEIGRARKRPLLLVEQLAVLKEEKGNVGRRGRN